MDEEDSSEAEGVGRDEPGRSSPRTSVEAEEDNLLPTFEWVDKEDIRLQLPVSGKQRAKILEKGKKQSTFVKNTTARLLRRPLPLLEAEVSSVYLLCTLS